LREGIQIEDSELEKLVVGFRKGIGSNLTRREFKVERLPLKADKWWAWLFGYYFGCATVYLRTGYSVAIRLRAHEPVVPLVVEIVRKVGGHPVVRRLKTPKPLVKDKGLGTTHRREIVLGSPEYLVLQKFGLPTEFEDVERDHSGSRAYMPRIPVWIKINNEFMRSFIEGFINGSGCNTVLHPQKGSRTKEIPILFIYLRMIGQPEEYVKQFLLDIKKYFDKYRIRGYFRKCDIYNVENRVQYELCYNSKEAYRFFLSHFNIVRPDIRARLTVKIHSDKDPVLYEILRELKTPANVVLGMIVERPRTKEEVELALQMRKEGVAESLRTLQVKGITQKGERYYYHPQKFKANVVRKIKRTHSLLTEHIKEYSSELLYQCRGCQKVYSSPQKCSCGKSLQPVDRMVSVSSCSSLCA
jgi:hypothetical protein